MLAGDPITTYKYSYWEEGQINTGKEKELLKLVGDVGTDTSEHSATTSCQENSSPQRPFPQIATDVCVWKFSHDGFTERAGEGG